MKLSDPRACWVLSSSVLAAKDGSYVGLRRDHRVESNHAHALVIRACFAVFSLGAPHMSHPSKASIRLNDHPRAAAAPSHPSTDRGTIRLYRGAHAHIALSAAMQYGH
jgi:hypothetical protein